MAGAYTAKPDTVPSEPDVPPGWEPTWPFPGPLPPGYEPEYTIVTTAPSSLAPDGTASITSTIRDHDDYSTSEPSSVSWTASIDGTFINLKFDGGSFSSVITEDPEFGDYWGTTPSIVFDLDDDNLGDTVLLQASCTLRGDTLTDTSNIEVVENQFSCLFQVTSYTHNSFAAHIGTTPSAKQYVNRARWSSGAWTYVDPVGSKYTAENQSVGVAWVDPPSPDFHYARYSYSGEGTTVLTFTTYNGGVQQEQYQKIIPDGGPTAWYDWLSWETATNSVTLINQAIP